MVNSKFTFDVPPDLKRTMADHPEVNWSAVFREAIRTQARSAELARRIQEEEADPRVRAIVGAAKQGAARRFRAAKAKGAA